MTRLRLNYEDDEELDKIIKQQVKEIEEAQRNIVNYLQEQGKMVDTIEDNVLKAEFNKLEGEADMKIVKKNNRKKYTLVAGSVILGTIMGTTLGPIAILPGIAVGGFLGSQINSIV